MTRFAHRLAQSLALAGTLALIGCSGSGSGLSLANLTTGTTKPAAGTPETPAPEDPMARPVQVAWTAARAKRCGFFFDPAKLRSTYFAYESSHGAAGEQLAKMEKTYDTTFATISTRVSEMPAYCTDSVSADIKRDLQRHLAGDYTPSPKKKVIAQCGGLFDPCVKKENGPFDPAEYWKQKEKENNMAVGH
ncbi:MAG TPA: hypothetical protein VG900_05435 [Hyphomicrobiaceae bacterium]|jgi:hypothetical protein|nr:hypothetical protein [Hyphomicrobiaceae bacterium]